MMASRRIGKVALDKSALFLCDMQEKFRKTIKYFPQIIETTTRVLNAAKILDMPILVTEQYPQGLGHTVQELDIKGLPVFPKTQFSMVLPELEQYLRKESPDVKSIILCGIEAQACIQQTTLDLLDRDYDVHVLADCVSSRSMVDRMYALQRMHNAGAFITTSESIILALVADATHPKFRDLQKLIRDEAPDSGLLQ